MTIQLNFDNLTKFEIFVWIFIYILMFSIIFCWWYWYMCHNISPLPPSTQHPTLPQAIPTPRPCPWVMCTSSLVTPFPMLYFLPTWPFCNYLFVLLDALISSPIFPQHPPTRQASKCSSYPWLSLSLCSCLLSLYFRFSCWQICIFAILLFIALIAFFFLNNFL